MAGFVVVGGFGEPNIKKEKKLGRKFNSILAGWSWFQLETFLKYKAALAGKSVEYVDARYTSQKCSCCGHIERASETITSLPLWEG